MSFSVLTLPWTYRLTGKRSRRIRPARRQRLR